MASTETLNFESARALHSLYAGDEAHLRKIEKTFSVKLTSRDGWLKIEGTRVNIKLIEDLFLQLQKAQQKGLKIRKHEFHFALDAVKNGQGSKLEELWNVRISLSSKKAAILPKTFLQQHYIKQIMENDLVFGIGPAGTGKTYLAMAMGVAALKNEQISRIILTRPAVEAGEALGFLPGDLQQKIFPYLRPLYDALYDMLDFDEVQRYMEKGIIEIAPLAYMRGRTLNRAFIILDEAQNTTTEQMFMFLTRLGLESKCVVTGDPSQIDLSQNKKSGLVEAIDALEKISGISFVQFEATDVIRHELVTSIVHAYKKYRSPGA